MNRKDEIQKRVNGLYKKYGYQLEEIIEKFENQYKKFMMETEGESCFQIILRAHLYIEYEMSEILIMRLKNPEELGNLNFNTKLKILLAVGAIPQDLKAPINFLNKTRNSYAHELNYKFDEGNYELLLNTFSKEFKETSLNRLNSTDCLSKKLRETLFALWEVLVEYRLINDEVREELNKVFY
jgi:hypothetical protein